MIFVCDFFAITRKVYEKKSVNCPSASVRSELSWRVVFLCPTHMARGVSLSHRVATSELMAQITKYNTFVPRTPLQLILIKIAHLGCEYKRKGNKTQ